MMMIPFLIGGALVVAYVFGWFGEEQREHLPLPKRKRGVSSDSTALEALEARYARGEISREEYLAIREDLRS